MSSEFITKLNKFLEENLEKEIDNNNFNGQIAIFALEVNPNQTPGGVLAKVYAPPFSSIGILDYLRSVIDDTQNRVYEQIDKDKSENVDIERGGPEEISKLAKMIPEEFATIMEDYDEKIKDAIKREDLDELENLKKIIISRIKEILNKKGDDPDNFNIDDFIGGF